MQPTPFPSAPRSGQAAPLRVAVIGAGISGLS
jgi:hypothetical protein